MEWVRNLNEAIRYIEAHLQEDVDYVALARIAQCSAYHFQRMFSYLADVSLAEYIRRRKMSRAAADLQSGMKVVDVSLKYGYDSPTAFNRAFQSVHGIAPSEAKVGGAPLKAYLPISFKITIKGESEMNYRIEQKDAFRMVGITERFVFGDEQSMCEIPLFWQRATEQGAFMPLLPLINQPPFGLLGVSHCKAEDGFSYSIAVSTTAPAPDGMDEITAPACTWAIFECIGPMPDTIQSLQKRIMTEWLPTSGYEYADAPDIEVYSESDMTAADYRCEVWLPVKQAEK